MCENINTLSRIRTLTQNSYILRTWLTTVWRVSCAQGASAAAIAAVVARCNTNSSHEAAGVQ